MSIAVAPPLWRQLQATVDVLTAVAQGQSAHTAMAQVHETDRPAVQSLSFAVWRHLGYARFISQHLAARRPRPWVYSALCCGLALMAPDATRRYDEFTLVDQLVESVKRRKKESAHAGFVNGCLRRFLRERAALDALAQQDDEARWNFPRWWIQRLQHDHPHQWADILRASNAPAPMTLRVNARRLSRDDYCHRLKELGIPAHAQGQSAVVLEQPLPVGKLPGFLQGDVSVQDAGAQRAAELLLTGFEHSVGTRILDACAAPGGKTGHLLEQTDASVDAVEVDPQRAARITDNLQRLGLAARVHRANLLDTNAWWDGRPFDMILLDAPCTASGIVRRHPDVRWQRREADVGALAAMQSDMLDRMWSLVVPGGRLLFCTCSVFAKEGHEQQQAFLQRNTDAKMLPATGHLLPTHAQQSSALAHNDAIDHDGFFYALFQKMPC